MINKSDYIIIGAGIYGLYASKLLIDKGYRVMVLEHDSEAFMRASFINQARVHRGYHYPRSYTTAIKNANYFSRFSKEFEFAINNRFTKIYGIAKKHSLTSAEQFKTFCNNVRIPCDEIDANEYFVENLVEKAFITEEYSFDAFKIKEWLLNYLLDNNMFSIFYNIRISDTSIIRDCYYINTEGNGSFCAQTVLNAAYASVNQIIEKFGFTKFDVKYEISEMIICHVSNSLKDKGITLMDGPFFSIMPFGHNNLHSLTSVTFTHHKTCIGDLPVFSCQQQNKECTAVNLENCNTCDAKPMTAFVSMLQLAKKYLKNDFDIGYEKSLYSIKPILNNTKSNDARPTLIVEHSQSPRLISVLSGKFNTFYDMEEVL